MLNQLLGSPVLLFLALLPLGLVAALGLLLTIVALNRRMGEIERAGITVNALLISRAERAVYLNNMEFTLTEAAIETLAVLAEALAAGGDTARATKAAAEALALAERTGETWARAELLRVEAGVRRRAGASADTTIGIRRIGSPVWCGQFGDEHRRQYAVKSSV